MITDKQKSLRMKGVGASDVPVITGHSTFKTAYALFKEKRGELKPTDAGIKADVGNLLEDGISKIFSHQTGTELFEVPETIYLPGYPYIFCHLDRETKDKIPVEIKNTSQGDEWGDPLYGPESIPMHVHIQVQMQMACTGSKLAFVAALLFGYDLKIYEIPRDQGLIDMLITRAVLFWKQVQAGTPPSICYNHPTTSDTLKRVYKGTSGKVIDLPAPAQPGAGSPHFNLTERDWQHRPC